MILSMKWLSDYTDMSDVSIKEYRISEIEKAVSENRKLYSVMAVNFSGNTTPKPECFYYIGTHKPQTPEETMYIKKQQKILYNCIKSLENIPEKRECYEKYKSAFRGITEILTEYNNGI